MKWKTDQKIRLRTHAFTNGEWNGKGVWAQVENRQRLWRVAAPTGAKNENQPEQEREKKCASF